jgi:hypothetical protein
VEVVNTPVSNEQVAIASRAGFLWFLADAWYPTLMPLLSARPEVRTGLDLREQNVERSLVFDRLWALIQLVRHLNPSGSCRDETSPPRAKGDQQVVQR